MKCVYRQGIGRSLAVCRDVQQADRSPYPMWSHRTKSYPDHRWSLPGFWHFYGVMLELMAMDGNTNDVSFVCVTIERGSNAWVFEDAP